MKLIDFDGQEIKLADEALLVRPIRELFLADKSKKKDLFWKQMSYLWFMCDPRSSYMYLTDEASRAKEVKVQEGLGEDWEPSEMLKEAMSVYRTQSITTQSLILESMRKGAEKVRSFLETIDLFATDRNDKPIYQVSTVTATLKQLPELARAMAEAEKALAKDYIEDDKARGNASKSLFEDV